MVDGTLAGARVALVLATSTGGVGEHVRSLCARLVAGGLAVTVHGPRATEEVFAFTATGARFAPVEIGSGLRALADPGAVTALRGSTRAADVVHAHGLRAGLVAALAGWGRPTPLVVSWHNAVLADGPLNAALGAGVERVVARRAQITLGASDDLVARALAVGGCDVRPAPVGVAPPRLPGRVPLAVREELGAGDRPLVLAVGRLHPQKGYDLLVAAASRWARRDRPPLVVIAGSGPLEARIRAEVDRSGAPVRLLGRRTDVAELMAAADVVVLPSRWEARSLVAQEALHAGRPLVATAVGGLPGLLADGAALVPPGDLDAFDGAVCRLLDDPAAAAELAARGRERARTWPTENDTAAQVRAVYAELLGAVDQPA